MRTEVTILCKGGLGSRRAVRESSNVGARADDPDSPGEGELVVAVSAESNGSPIGIGVGARSGGLPRGIGSGRTALSSGFLEGVGARSGGLPRGIGSERTALSSGLLEGVGARSGGSPRGIGSGRTIRAEVDGPPAVVGGGQTSFGTTGSDVGVLADNSGVDGSERGANYRGIVVKKKALNM